MSDNGYSHTFYVDDARDVADATPGDGVCATRFSAGTPAVPTCTLYAAIQEANALPADASVLIAPAPQIRLVNGTYAASAEIQLPLIEQVAEESQITLAALLGQPVQALDREGVRRLFYSVLDAQIGRAHV